MDEHVQNINRTTKLEDVDVDSQAIMLKELSIKDMISYAKTNKYFYNLVKENLRRRFLTKEVIFSTLYGFSKANDIEETDTYIMIRHAPTAVKVLEDFGRSLRILRIQQIQKSDDIQSTENIYNLMQEQCSGTLRQLHLKNVGQSLVLKKPFTNVVNLRLQSDTFNGCDVLDLENKFSLNELFPSLRSLHLAEVNILNSSGIAMEFQHLEELSVHINSTEFLSESSVTELIIKNPQLKTLRLIEATSDLLQIVADVNVKLQTLELNKFHELNNRNVHFENVQSFKMSGYKCQNVPKDMTFGPNLIEFILDFISLSSGDNDHNLIEFIENNKNLQIFQTNEVNTLSNNDFARLAAANTNLIEFITSCAYGVSNDNIVKFIKNNQKLKRIHLTIYKSSRQINQTVALLHNHFDEEWLVNVIDNKISLEKKNTNE